MLTIIETILAVLLLLWISWTALTIFLKAKAASKLMEEAKPYDALTTDYAKTLLILGDSTGVGTGAALPEDTVAAQLGAHLGATYVENQAKNGAAVEDLSTQIQHLHLSHYDFILIQVGGNDILAFHPAKKTAEKLDKIMDTLPDTGQIVFMSAGNVGGTTLIPYIARPFYTFLTLQFHKEFEKLAEKRGITYVNLYEKPSGDPFIKEPEKYLASDGLHPSGEGYKLWFQSLMKELS